MDEENSKISSGSSIIDWLLEGGFEKDVVTTVFGPPGSGKSNLCMICLARNPDKKIIYIDTEGSFSVARLKQLTDDYETILKNVIVLNPTDFDEQKKVFDKLKKLVNDKIGLIIVDSIAMLYRLEVGKTKDVFNVNRDLGVQLADLVHITRKFKIPVLVTNQVYSDFEHKDKINMVGGDILKYASKCLIELQSFNGAKKAILRKHRSLPEGKEVIFKIIDNGFEEIEE
ncbi:DNA repair and recombination protein RadB [Candidatus Woesearchaeota archaeon]|nr:DNA repair and recombination protein RadB [Candidatus Woesearchaeota archaeon]MCF7900797.1 DNA repair and recombination protein RadB [Candidatus Woesearchaeota archaeon]MCF8013099.1 DNA repair and recombination protein RadB [Candidatus Woesearchaeota archaeon]